jgi:Protein of unknown function (DUF1524)
VWKKALRYFIGACVVVAVIQSFPSDPKAAYEELKKRSDTVEAAVKDGVENGVPQLGSGSGSGGSGSSGNTSASASVDAGARDAARSQLAGLPVAAEQQVAYNRDQWRHWDNMTSCWTVREQVLARDAEPGSLSLKDRNGQRTSDVSKACEITGGKWNDPYTGEVFTNPSDLDIDHVVALGQAARSGGNGWPEDRKRDYANDLTDPTHLLAVSASANRAKSDKDPAQWVPANTGFHCRYAVAWTGVKATWGLSVDQAEKDALGRLLDTCK